jgi:hypothetical protein
MWAPPANIPYAGKKGTSWGIFEILSFSFRGVTMTRSSKLSILGAAVFSAIAASQAQAGFTYDLRFAPSSQGISADGKTVVLVDSAGVAVAQTTFTLQLWGQISGNTVMNDDVAQMGWVSLKSQQGSNGGALTSGGLSGSAYNSEQFPSSNKLGAKSTTLSSDGIDDWGSTSTASTANSAWFHWYNANGGNTAPAPNVPGTTYGDPVAGKSQPVAGTDNAWEVLCGTFTVEVKTRAPQGLTDLSTSFVVGDIPTGIKTGLSSTDPGILFYQDGSATQVKTGSTGTGATFVIQAVTTEIPEPASLGVLALGGLALLARRRK